ncbi:hypothetical protein QVD17_12046 [Tagetes erecta]|uniref:Uncharacterized protein n=1 Tax=Tagetes erecta TaxID=13708 RepID=A0AAD8L1U0_TARER|nr:hypothetical protein QVD17_12046 [Tagetes erecta]
MFKFDHFDSHKIGGGIRCSSWPHYKYNKKKAVRSTLEKTSNNPFHKENHTLKRTHKIYAQSICDLVVWLCNMSNFKAHIAYCYFHICNFHRGDHEIWKVG